MVEPLPERQFAELDDFFRQRLQPGERTAILRRLAA
jgi:hypothetical protein